MEHKALKGSFVATVLTVSWTSVAAAGDLRPFEQALELWAPTEVRLAGSTLTVRLPQRRITEDIYYAVLPFGVCLATLREPPAPPFDEVHIENQFGGQAWVFEGGTDECADIVSMPSTDVRLYVAARTHLR